jgi:DUF971 family protein
MKATASQRVRRITQVDNTHFSIEWSDGRTITYRLSDLQRQCPCAGCVDENSGRRVVDPSRIDDSVRCVKINSVGRYALRIQFTSGCSNGIYGYDILCSSQ